MKNLPSYISDQRLKEHFSSQGGTITDVKLVHRPDGTSRRFAFIGFKTDSEAAKAKNYLDRSYIDTSRISVLVVDPVSYYCCLSEFLVHAKWFLFRIKVLNVLLNVKNWKLLPQILRAEQPFQMQGRRHRRTIPI